jgi:hypothetical protein
MIAESPSGELLIISGETVRARDATFSETYNSVVTLGGHYYIDDFVAKSFLLKVQGPDGNILEEIPMKYETIKCTCASYDTL